MTGVVSAVVMPGLPGRADLELQARSVAPGTVLVEAAGSLTTATRERLRWLLRAVSPAGERRLLIDCSAVSDADPAGVAVLLIAARTGRALGRELLVVNASQPVRQLFERVGAQALLVEDGGPG